MRSDKHWCCETQFAWMEEKAVFPHWGAWTEIPYVNGVTSLSLEIAVEYLKYRRRISDEKRMRFRLRNKVTQEIIPGDALHD